MSKYLLVIYFFLSCTIFGVAQKSVNDFSYVSVPDLYEFLHEKDQYQLNSITKHLFNKYGFNAYFESELPNVRRCDGLYATLEGKPGFIYTKITVILKDCHGDVVFQGLTGRSKQKDYKKAYHQSIRQAFESVAALNANQKDIVIDTTANNNNDAVVKKDELLINEEKKTNETTVVDNTYSTATHVKMPEAKFSSYTSGDSSYLLRKTAKGYSLYLETANSVDDLKLIGTFELNGDTWQFANLNGAIHTVITDDQENITISREDFNMNLQASN